jgi:hypothetical protein
MARLIVKCGGAELVTHELVGDVIMIGHSPLNHIVIDHPTVSSVFFILAVGGN